MPSDSQTVRTLSARIAANSRWAHEPDRAAATQPARISFDSRFLREVDPDGVLPPDEAARRAQNARQAYFSRLALRSAQARRRAKEANQAVIEAVTQELVETRLAGDVA